MAVPPDIVQAAARYQGQAVRQILTENYPRVHRMAYGLSGSGDIGRQITTQVMRQALRRMPDWTTEGEPERWFDHHTILLWRRMADMVPSPTADLLVANIHEPSGEYTAFVRALRHLPSQQREAFLLAAGEGYDERQCGIAMDCSRTAAANHLSAARQALMEVCGGDAELQRHGITIGRAWQAMTQSAVILTPRLNRSIVRYIWFRRLRWMGRILFIILLAVAGAVGWKLWWAMQSHG